MCSEDGLDIGILQEASRDSLIGDVVDAHEEHNPGDVGESQELIEPRQASEAGSIRRSKASGAYARVENGQSGAVETWRQSLREEIRPVAVRVECRAAPSVIESPSVTIVAAKSGERTWTS